MLLIFDQISYYRLSKYTNVQLCEINHKFNCILSTHYTYVFVISEGLKPRGRNRYWCFRNTTNNLDVDRRSTD